MSGRRSEAKPIAVGLAELVSLICSTGVEAPEKSSDMTVRVLNVINLSSLPPSWPSQLRSSRTPSKSSLFQYHISCDAFLPLEVPYTRFCGLKLYPNESVIGIPIISVQTPNL